MWELNHKEGWVPKNWFFQIVVLKKTLESPLDCKEIKPVHPKGDQHWIFIGRTDAKAEAPMLWPPDVKSWLNEKDPDAGKDWGWEEKGTTEDKVVGWHHQLNGHESEQTQRDREGQGSLACFYSMESQRVGHGLMTEHRTTRGRRWEKGTTEDETVEWHHWFNGHEFEEVPGVDDGQEAWHGAVHGVTESVMTEGLNWIIN